VGPCWQRGPCGPRPAGLGVSAEGRAKAKAQGRRPAIGTTPSLGAACAVAGCAQPAVMRAHTGRVPVGAARQLAPAHTADASAGTARSTRGHAGSAAGRRSASRAPPRLDAARSSGAAEITGRSSLRASQGECRRGSLHGAASVHGQSGEVREAERRDGFAPDAAQPRAWMLSLVKLTLTERGQARCSLHSRSRSAATCGRCLWRRRC
jgi:hypothetical protein